MRKHRDKDVVYYAYTTLKHNAKRRNKVFTISYEYFKMWCAATDYIAGKGRTKKSATVDRGIEELGYIEGNLQKLRNDKNIKKYLNYVYQTRTATVSTVAKRSDEWFDE